MIVPRIGGYTIKSTHTPVSIKNKNRDVVKFRRCSRTLHRTPRSSFAYSSPFLPSLSTLILFFFFFFLLFSSYCDFFFFLPVSRGFEPPYRLNHQSLSETKISSLNGERAFGALLAKSRELSEQVL